jgi:hypothetical protein
MLYFPLLEGRQNKGYSRLAEKKGGQEMLYLPLGGRQTMPKNRSAAKKAVRRCNTFL